MGLLYGERGVYSTATLIAAEIIARRGPVVIVDAANRTDPYYLARLARYRNIDPHEFLGKAYVSRAFTFYQIDVALTQGLPEVMRRTGAGVLLVYGLLDLIDDEQVTLTDIREIFGRIARVFSALKEQNVSTLLVSTLPHFHLREREQMFSLLTKMSDVAYRINYIEGYQQIIFEGGKDGKNRIHGNTADPAGGIKLVKIPPGAQKRGSGYSR